MSFQKFLFGQLPLYYKIQDTYKDQNDEGLFERYLEIFGLELDQELMPLVDDYLRIVDPFDTDDKYLTTLGYTLGSPPDLLGNPANYAKLLAYIIQVYKIKGTARALQLLFSLLGFNISVVEYPPSQTVLLDDSNILDDNKTLDSGCPGCSDYEVVVNTLLTPGSSICSSSAYGVVTPQILPTFIKIIEFNQPINADLIGLINGGLVCEEIDLCVDSVINIVTMQSQTLDNSIILDDLEYLDGGDIIEAIPIYEACGGGGTGTGIGFDPIGTTQIL